MDVERVIKEKILLVKDDHKKDIRDIEVYMRFGQDLNMNEDEIKCLILELEEIFNIEILDKELENIIVVEDLVKNIKEKTACRKAGGEEYAGKTYR